MTGADHKEARRVSKSAALPDRAVNLNSGDRRQPPAETLYSIETAKLRRTRATIQGRA
jgi:hypothetical protein